MGNEAKIFCGLSWPSNLGWVDNDIFSDVAHLEFGLASDVLPFFLQLM